MSEGIVNDNFGAFGTPLDQMSTESRVIWNFGYFISSCFLSLTAMPLMGQGGG